jgi:TRAP-type C4-dicarboxylate transport system substrate-binding protein
MKASGITIATAEVPVALQRGVVNGVMTAGYNARGSKWGEFLDWGYLLHEHMAGPHYVVANERAFNRLSAELQGQLRDEAEKLGARIHADMNNNESSALKDLVATYNITLVEPSAADRKQMLDMMVPYWEEWAKQQGAEGERQLAILRKAMGR